MTIDLNIVTRALQKAGQEPLTQDDIEKNSTRWRTVKAFYLATILETLSRTSWTSQKRRQKLLSKNKKKSGFNLAYKLPEDFGKAVSLSSGEAFSIIDRILYTEDPEAELCYEDHYGNTKNDTLIKFNDNFTQFAYCYALPDDCAKPEELLNNQEFIVEGNFLYTDDDNAVLMYVTNRNVKQEVKVEKNGDIYLELDEDCNLYWVYDEETDSEDDCPYEIEEGKLYYTAKDDYDDFGELNYDPLLERFLETRLAADIALKITGDKGIYETLYNESLLIENEAENGTKAQARSKKNGNDWWTDRIGLGGEDAHY